MEVIWPIRTGSPASGGVAETFLSIPADTLLTIVEQDLSDVHKTPVRTPVGLSFSHRPNPFKHETIIELTARQRTSVTISVCSVSGRHIATLLQGELSPGKHTAVWTGVNTQGRRVSPGIYFCTVSTGDFSETKRIVLVR
jgi:hypothetical protein